MTLFCFECGPTLHDQWVCCPGCGGPLTEVLGQDVWFRGGLRATAKTAPKARRSKPARPQAPTSRGRRDDANLPARSAMPSADVSAMAHARAYAASCSGLVKAAKDVLEVANRAVNARGLSMQGHEISRATFLDAALEAEAEFVPLYKAFDAACTVARDAAISFRAAAGSEDVEVVLHGAVDGDTYSQTEVAGHMLRTRFGPTPSTFLEGIAAANAAVQADIYYFGDDGFIGHVYAPVEVAEKVRPWCAEAIKSAAIICRFCNRDVTLSVNKP